MPGSKTVSLREETKGSSWIYSPTPWPVEWPKQSP